MAVNADGSVSVDSSVTGGNGIVKYDIRIYKGGVLYDVRLGQPSPNLNIDSLENGDYSVLVQVKNENGQLLSEKTQTFTINKPPAPTGVRTTGGLGNITLEWDWVDDATATEIFASETDDIKTAKRLTKVTARMYTHEVGAKQVRYYWLRHTRGVNVGPFNQQSGIKGESAVNIDAELEVLNKKLSQNIVNEVIDTALPARNLEMIKTVTGLNVNEFLGYKQVHNTADGRLYTWNGSKYIENGVDVNGIRINTTQLVGTLQADQIGVNTIGAGALQAGAVRANHLAAGEVTADKLAIGLGGNLLNNPIFANIKDNKVFAWSKSGNSSNYTIDENTDFDYGLKGRGLATENCLRIINNDTTPNNHIDVWQIARVFAGKYYIVSVYGGSLKSIKAEMIIQYRTVNASNIRSESTDITGDFSNWNNARVFRKIQIPNDCKAIKITFRLTSVAKNSILLLARPMVEECTEHATQPSAWQNAGVTSIHGGSIVTRTITTEQLAANSVTANEIATGAVTAKHVAANSIGANHVATRSLTADKLNVTSLSAISADLGDITGGSININNRFKVSNQGQVEMRAATGNVGLVIKSLCMMSMEKYV